MFDVSTARDFYAILVEDFDEYFAEAHSARRAMHCALTAYHLHEWVWAEISKSPDILTKLEISKRDKGQFLKWIDGACVYFPMVQELANGTKHFAHGDGTKTMLVGGWGQGPYGVGPFGKGYLLIDYGEGAGEHRWQTALTLLEVVVRFWRDFFLRYLPMPDLPVSKHHVD